MSDICRKKSTKAAKYITVLTAFFLLLFGSLGITTEAADEANTAVLIAPFSIEGPEDLAYLSEALANMLASRLSVHEGLTIIGEPLVLSTMKRLSITALDSESAGKLGTETGADRVVAGRFSKDGDTIVLEATIIDPSGVTPTATVFHKDQSMRRLIEGISALAEMVNYKIKGLEIIVDIEIRGNRMIEDAAILYRISAKKGDVFSPEVIQESIREIYEMGYFNDIKVDSTDDPLGKRLAFIVEENPEIAAIKITGNLEVDTNTIQEELDLLPHTILNYTKMKDNVLKIKRLYKGKGYYNALVDYAVEPLGDGKATVTFQIVEHHSMRIKEVEFVGNENVKSKKLRKIMETRKKGLFSFITDSGLFKEEALQKDLERIKAYYYDYGYMDIEVGEPEVSHDDEWIYITIPLKEGSQYTVSSVDVSGDTIEPPETLVSQYISLQPGQVFSRKNIREDMSALTELYGQRGYAFADVTPLTKVNAEERTLGVTYDITKGEEVYFEDITITGNTRTRDKVIRRELRFKEEDLYSSTKLNKSRERLDNLGYFEEVTVNTKRGTKPDKVDVDVEVKEKPTGMISMGAGYSSVDNIVAMFQLSQENFLGKGLRAQFSAQIGGNNRYRIGLTNPYLFDKEISAGFNLFRSDIEYDDFDTTSTGFDVGIGFRPFGWEDWRLGFNYELSRTEVKDINFYCYDDPPPCENPCDPEDPECENPCDSWQIPDPCDCNDLRSTADLEIVEAEGTTTTSSLATTLSHDTVDNRFYPMRGDSTSLALQIAGGPFMGPEKFYKITFDAKKFFPFRWGTAFMARGALGYVDGYSGKDVPVFERFFLGGLDSLRGYEYRTVGPKGTTQSVLQTFKDEDGGTCVKPVYYTGDSVVGGNKMILFNFEYLFPIVKAAKIRGLVFYDTGNAFAEGESYDPSDLRSSIGWGIRWNSPFGPLRIEWGYALDAEDDEDDSQFEFSFGTGF